MKRVRSPVVKMLAKVTTGIAGFDEITGGGLPRGRTTLLVGGPGSGETILAALCRACPPDRHEIEPVDVFREPKHALADGIFMTPTLVKLAPSPARRIVGTLSQAQIVLDALGLAGVVA